MAPAVSVIVPVFNGERFLAETLDSVLAQTYRDWQLILVDDGSTDRTPEIAARYLQKDPERIRIARHPGGANLGLAASRNLGVAAARGAYITFVDADDIWLPCKLEEQVALLEALPDAAMLCGVPLYWHSWAPKDASPPDDYTRDPGIGTDRLYGAGELLKRVYPLGDAVSAYTSDLCIRRDAFDAVGGFAAEFTGMHEDTAFLVKVYRWQPVYVSSRCWTWYRRHPQSMSATVKGAELARIRLHFAGWLERYLADVDDTEINSAVARFRWEASHPRWTAVKRRCERLVKEMTK